MQISSRPVRALYIAVVAAFLSSAIIASSASASTPVEWNVAKATAAKLVSSGSAITVKEGVSSTTCTLVEPTSGEVSNSGGQGSAFFSYGGFYTRFKCATGLNLTISMLAGTATAEGLNRYLSMPEIVFEQSSPFPGDGGWYTPTAYTGVFKNGTATSPSKWSFNEVTVGSAQKAIKITGALSVTTSTGGLLTMK
jgi:hypothetical protein